jgi:hypothetical protein
MDTTNIVAIASLIGALGSAFAAIAAFRSAGIAKSATDHASAIEKRTQVREVVRIGNEVIAETIRIDALAAKCILSFRTLATFSGATGGSIESVHIKALEEKRKSMGPVQDRALEVIESYASIQKESGEHINGLLSELDNYLIHTRRVKEEIQEQYADLEDQNRIHREKVIRDT